MSRWTARVARLEEQVAGASGVDLEAEAARFGGLLWAAGGRRCYGRQEGDVYELTVIGGGDGVRYAVRGIDGTALV
ncbi:hypothetical protein [Streptomyces sp. C10-9-1]|uniref:hypothetical protein n=1 Tax=Streptomyces sp. C10-9-1 TaxID=1859285 RepID=UPI003F4A0078